MKVLCWLRKRDSLKWKFNLHEILLPFYFVFIDTLQCSSIDKFHHFQVVWRANEIWIRDIFLLLQHRRYFLCSSRDIWGFWQKWSLFGDFHLVVSVVVGIATMNDINYSSDFRKRRMKMKIVELWNFTSFFFHSEWLFWENFPYCLMSPFQSFVVD